MDPALIEFHNELDRLIECLQGPESDQLNKRLKTLRERVRTDRRSDPPEGNDYGH